MINVRFFRKWHRWVSIFVTLPFFVTVTTGILLATRGFNTWVQPESVKSQPQLTIGFAQILESARSVPDARINTWKDVSQIDIRPSSGLIRLRANKSDLELQIDGASGKVLAAQVRRASWITSLHEGAYFGGIIRYGLFLPAAVGVFFLLCSGVVLYLQPMLRKRL